QDNNLVYYLMHANDVYAYFHSGIKNNVIKSNYFPTSSPELKEIKGYASRHGIRRISDEKALVVELKTSWIEVPDKQINEYSKHYVVMEGVVPSYDKSPRQWVENGTITAKLAMTGMHIAFSVPGI